MSLKHPDSDKDRTQTSGAILLSVICLVSRNDEVCLDSLVIIQQSKMFVSLIQSQLVKWR